MSSTFRKTERGYIYYKLAEEYYRNHGNLIIPVNYKIDNYNLGLWLSKIRTLYKQGKLSEQKIEMLNNIGMKWNVNSLEIRKYKFFNSTITDKNKIKYEKFLLDKLKKILVEYKKEEINKVTLYEINKEMLLNLE